MNQFPTGGYDFPIIGRSCAERVRLLWAHQFYFVRRFNGSYKVHSVYLCRCVDGGQARWLVTNENAHTWQPPLFLRSASPRNTPQADWSFTKLQPPFRGQAKTQTAAHWSFMESGNIGLQLICSSWPRIKCVRLAPTDYVSLALLAPSCNLLPRKNVQCAGIGGQALFLGHERPMDGAR